MNMAQMLLEDEKQVGDELKSQVNAIVRFENGCTFNKIADKLLREGGHIRGTREILEKDMKNRRILFANSTASKKATSLASSEQFSSQFGLKHPMA